MKGAIGNAFILNMVITFIIIFFSLLIGSMAYSKAYKTKNFLLNLIDEFERNEKRDFGRDQPNNIQAQEWNEKANEYLQKVGYPLAKEKNCHTKKYAEQYGTFKNNGEGQYDYCIYKKISIIPQDMNPIVANRYNYMVLVYMKLDLPVIGDYIKIPITGETKQYTYFK